MSDIKNDAVIFLINHPANVSYDEVVEFCKPQRCLRTRHIFEFVRSSVLKGMFIDLKEANSPSIFLNSVMNDSGREGNVRFDTDEKTGIACVRALRKIKAGEELLEDYLLDKNIN